MASDWSEVPSKPLAKLLTTDHEYHEISDEETNAPDSPRFDVSLCAHSVYVNEFNLNIIIYCSVKLDT